MGWDELEVKYGKVFGSDRGNVGKGVGMGLGGVMMERKLEFWEGEVVEEMGENGYVE